MEGKRFCSPSFLISNTLYIEHIMRCLRNNTIFRLMLRLPALVLALSCAGNAQTPNDVDTGSAHGEVVLTKLSPPSYPDIARREGMSGSVELRLEIRKDGSIKSAALVKGHEILGSAALDSASKSLFECRGCINEITPHLMVYTFQFGGPRCSPPDKQANIHITQLQNHIIVTFGRQPIVDIFSDAKPVRSAKCLYLFRCSHWSRSVRCLYLWNCGYGRKNKWKPDPDCPEVIR